MGGGAFRNEVGRGKLLCAALRHRGGAGNGETCNGKIIDDFHGNRVVRFKFQQVVGDGCYRARTPGNGVVGADNIQKAPKGVFNDCCGDGQAQYVHQNIGDSAGNRFRIIADESRIFKDIVHKALNIRGSH